MLSLLLLAVSVSIDSLGIGITYGLKDTMLTKNAKLILFIVSIIITSISVFFGNIITQILPNDITTILGGLILIFMGFWIIYQSYSKKEDNPKNKDINSIKKKSKKLLYKLFIKPLGITIQIIRDPIYSDLDNSKNIDWKEAFYLSFALSLDSLCVGLGISIIGVSSFLFPIFVAVFQLIFLSIGDKLGKHLIKVYSNVPNKIFTIISGLLLIIIGTIKMM